MTAVPLPDLPAGRGCVAVYERDGRIRHVSGEMRALLGRGEADRMRRAADIVVHPDDTVRVTRIHERAEITGVAGTAVVRLQHRDGSWVWVECELGAAEDPAEPGARVRYVAVLRNVTDDRRRLLSEVVAAREDERTRIADDVHDDTVQTIMAVEIKLDQLRRNVTTERQIAIVDDLRVMVRGAAERLRQLIFDLQPPQLPRGGLGGAVAEFATAVFDGTSTRLDIVAELPTEPSPETAVVVYRILQEALRNVRRHASATTCSVRIGKESGGVTASVDDDGVGFGSQDAAQRPGHRGMESMRRRAEVAGGWMRVESRADGGTSATLWVPDRNSVSEMFDAE
ncbi:MAG TPA: ATP-binding protein [Candidatus Dormibacteraeota bacterium]|nr:ATP-binding protein [Candidatus Dormibacteraeota bacterium]